MQRRSQTPSTAKSEQNTGSQGSLSVLSFYPLQLNFLVCTVFDSTYGRLWVTTLPPSGLGARSPEDYLVPRLPNASDTLGFSLLMDTQIFPPSGRMTQSLGETEL